MLSDFVVGLLGLKLFGDCFIEPVFIFEEEVHGVEHGSVGTELELFHDVLNGDKLIEINMVRTG